MDKVKDKDLKKCKYCLSDVPKKAVKCKHCGKTIGTTMFVKVLAVLLVLGFIGSLTDSDDKKSTITQQEQSKPYKEGSKYIKEPPAGYNAPLAQVCIEDYIEANLKSPSSADFPWNAQAMHVYGDKYRLRSYVDAQNTFGAMIRTNFDCTIELEWEADDCRGSVINCDFE